MAVGIAELAQTRLSRFGRVQVANTLAPGALAFADAGLFFHRWHVLGDLVKKKSDFNDWALFVAVILAAIAAYIAGVALRSLGFTLLRLARRTVLRLRWFRKAGKPRKELGATLGKANVRAALRGHEPLAHALSRVAHIGDAAWIDALDYAKFWLREHHPQIGVDQHEVEIGFWASISVPLAVLPFAIIRAGGWTWSWQHVTAAIAVAVVAVAFAIWRAHRRSVEESRDALRSFCFAQWFGPPPAS